MADAKTVIEAKLAALRPVRDQHVANANAVSGAIQALEELLKELSEVTIDDTGATAIKAVS